DLSRPVVVPHVVIVGRRQRSMTQADDHDDRQAASRTVVGASTESHAKRHLGRPGLATCALIYYRPATLSAKLVGTSVIPVIATQLTGLDSPYGLEHGAKRRAGRDSISR